MRFAQVCIHVLLKLPFPLFLILSIDIIIPTGINITSMWQPKRWYQCLLKDHCAFLPLTAVALSWRPWMKNPEGYWLQAMELVANKQPLGCIIMRWCIDPVQKVALSSQNLFLHIIPKDKCQDCAKWLKAMQCHCYIIW